MVAKDAEGRPLVNTPEEALQQLASDYDTYRFAATLSFSMQKKRAVLAGLEHTLNECKRVVTANRAAGRGEFATRWRKIEEFVRAQHAEMRMWILVRDHKFHAAWEALMSAQGSALWAARWLPEFEPAQRLEEHLDAVQLALFPKQRFFSPSMIIDESEVECTICHVRGGECDHIVGDVYAGEVANRLIHRLKGIREVSMVDNPANKYARAMSYGGMDLLTGESTKHEGTSTPSNARRHTKRRRR
jgi:hypothetical protein